MALDGAGNLYIADRQNQRIRKVDAAGVISTVAGDGTFGYGGDGGPAAAAQLGAPFGVALDGAGNLYITDTFNNRIRKVDAAGVISTVAGDGMRGYGGDGGPAAAAQLFLPTGVALDGAGNLYITDTSNNRIRKVDAAGVISTVAGDGTRGYGGDGGPATAAQLSSPYGVALDGAGNLYIADTRNDRIRKVDASGAISTVAGDGTQGYSGDGGPATAAQLRLPYGVALDGAGNLYIADTSNDRIRKVDASGAISTVAGDGTRGYGGDGGPATAAQLSLPFRVALDGAGNLYIADTYNNRIRKVDASGVITTVAGDGTRGYGGDGGPATAAQLDLPYGVALDGADNLYIADRNNHRIRKVDASGVITTVAGDGTRGYGGDGGPATAAQLDLPYGVALDGADNLYIADRNNDRIRKVDAAGVITTVAGDGTRGYGGDGGPAVAAQLNSPRGVALDGAGNLYIADSGNDRIRRLTPAPAPPPRIPADGIVLATGPPAVNRISPNAIISVFGQDFAGTRTLNPVIDADGGIAVNLAATCLEIGGKRTPLFVVTPGQINAQVPHDLAPGEAALTVIRGCGTANEQRSGKRNGRRRLAGVFQPGQQRRRAQPAGGAARRRPQPGRRDRLGRGVHPCRAGRVRHPVRNRLRRHRAAVGDGSNSGSRGRPCQRGCVYFRRHRRSPAGRALQGHVALLRRPLSIHGARARRRPRRRRNRHGHRAGRFDAPRAVPDRSPRTVIPMSSCTSRSGDGGGGNGREQQLSAALYRGRPCAGRLHGVGRREGSGAAG